MAAVYFLSLSFTFLHFLTIQTPLYDDKTRDVRLKPSSLKGNATGCQFLGKLAFLLLFMLAFMGVCVPTSHIRLKSPRHALTNVYLASFLGSVDTYH